MSFSPLSSDPLRRLPQPPAGPAAPAAASGAEPSGATSAAPASASEASGRTGGPAPQAPFPAPGLLQRLGHAIAGLVSRLKQLIDGWFHPPVWAAGPAGLAPRPTTYVVKPGDTLSAIAQQQLGNASRWREIYAANADRVIDPDVLAPGQVLSIPPIARFHKAPGPQVRNLDVAGLARWLKLPPAKVAANWPFLARALADVGMTDRASVVAVLATIKTEVPAFAPIPEYGTGDEYENRPDLGNTQPGDGRRYKGRGYIQLTGRKNYREYGAKLGIDLEGNPDLALQPEVAARVLALYCVDKQIPALARANDWRGVRKAVNGGYNGWATFNGAVTTLQAHPELFK